MFQTVTDKFLRFVQPVRQHFDNLSKCSIADHGGGCTCYPIEYINSFCLLEENGLSITNGEWKGKMRSILEKYPKYAETEKCEGKSRSVVALVRLLRNLMAHKDPMDHDYEIFKEIIKELEWLIPHCFTFWVKKCERAKSHTIVVC